MADFSRKSRIGSTIPTCSMADIAFLLLIFFMVTTVFVRYRVTGVLLPRAQQIEELKMRRMIQYVFVSADRQIFINDSVARLDQVAPVFYDFRVKEPRTVVSLKCDVRAPYGLVSQVLEELRKADALRINFAAEREG